MLLQVASWPCADVCDLAAAEQGEGDFGWCCPSFKSDLFQQVVKGLVQLAEPCVLVLREGHACRRGESLGSHM